MRKGQKIVRQKKSESHVGRFKPEAFDGYVTLGELSVIVNRDRDYLRRLEREERLPVPKRVQRGRLYVRLYSPRQVEECKEIIAAMRPGPKPRG
jgi:hypothetical protein